MTESQKHGQSNNEESLSAALYRAMVEAGMRLPVTVKEVEAAEAWVKEHGPELPQALKDKSFDELAQRQKQEWRLEP